MKTIGEQMWVADQPLRVAMLDLGARMTVIRLPRGGLVLHSPIDYTPQLGRTLEDLGPVAALVAPNILHDLYLDAWRAAYPGVPLYSAPGMKLAAAQCLTDISPWGEVIEQHIIGGMPRVNEVAFFHGPSRALILTDLAFNIARADSLSARLFLRANACYRRFGASRLMRLMIRDKAACAASLHRIMQWDFDKVILSHGEVVLSDGKRRMAEAFTWLL